MTLTNKEVVGDGSESELPIPSLPVGIFIENEVRKNVAHHGDSTWLTNVSTGKSMSYTQMIGAIRSIASGLRKRGLRVGDNVVVIGSNCIEIPLMTLGVWRAGGSQASLAVKLLSDVIEAKLREIRSKFVLTDYARARQIVDVTQRLDFVCEVFVIEDVAVPGCSRFQDLLEDPGDECPENLNEVNLDSMAWLAYTSGTTGLPKGVVKTQRTVIASILPRRYTNGTKRSNYLVITPMVQSAGIQLIMALTLDHMEVYCMSDFSEEKLLSCVDRYKPQGMTLGSHFIAWMCRCEYLDKYDLSSVKGITATGSQINPIYERDIFTKLPNLRFVNNQYGMTEIGTISRTPPIRQDELLGLSKEQAIAGHTFGSAGRVVAHCKVKVIDVNSGEKLSPNQVGEICIQSPSLLNEYFNRPEETADFLRNGWAHTGDKGYYDENENIFIIGRYKELIKYRNAHVVPTNVEKHIMTHPAVKDVAVVGLPDDDDGERPLAFVVLSPDSQHVTVDELIAYTNERVMDEENLRGGLRFIDNIPRNDLGKVVRPELMKLLN